jgi:hypothetical protein
VTPPPPLNERAGSFSTFSFVLQPLNFAFIDEPFPYMCYAQNPSHKNNTGGPERATSPQRRRPENGRGKEGKKQFHGTGLFHVPTVPSEVRPQTLQMFTTTSTPQTTNQTNFSLSSTPPRSNQRKSDQKQKSWSGACRALRSAPSTPPPRRSKSHAPAADSRELRLQLVQATNLLQLLQARSRGHTGVSRMRRMHVCARYCLSCAGRGAVTGKARTNGGEPLAHLWSQEEPIRDALELVHVVDLLATSPRSAATHAQKGGKNIISSGR